MATAVTTKEKKNLFTQLREQAKARTAYTNFSLEYEGIGTIDFRIKPVTVHDLMKVSSTIPSYFSGLRGKGAESDGQEDDEEVMQSVLDNLEMSRVVVCESAQIITKEPDGFIRIVDKEADDCGEDEMSIEAFSNEQIASIATEAMGKIRFR